MIISEQKAIVTGGASGLGRCLVDKLIQRGARVTVFDINNDGLQEVSRQHPAVECVCCDITDPEQVAKHLGAYHKKAGAAHILINNAGILYSEPLVKFGEAGLQMHSLEAWHRVLACNLHSIFDMSRHVAAAMIRSRIKGVIVNISSVAAAGNSGQTAYSAAKAGVNALTAVWAKELGAMGIRVVAVAPGFIETASTKQALSEAVLQETIKRVPLKRLGKPEELADGVIAVIENDFFNGKVFELDGGLVI